MPQHVPEDLKEADGIATPSRVRSVNSCDFARAHRRRDRAFIRDRYCGLPINRCEVSLNVSRCSDPMCPPSFMNRRLALPLLLALVATGVLVWSAQRTRHGVTATATTSSRSTGVVAIQDGKALDFSSGKPVFKADQSLASRVAELDAVAQTVSFAPKPNATASSPGPKP